MGISDQRYTYRPTPQLSAAQLAEYLGATAPRRTSIIRSARFPKTSVVAQYDKAREGLVNFLADGARSANHLAKASDYLAKRKLRPGATAWLLRDSQFSIEAIEAFQLGYNKLGFPKILCRAVTGKQPYLVFGPTRISVALDVTTHKTGNPQDHVGGAILLFSRGEKSDKARVERSRTMAGLAYVFCSTHLKHLGAADPSICYAVDVFNSKSYTPPGTFVQRLKQIQNACDEIGARWSSVHAPADYDGPNYP